MQLLLICYFIVRIFRVIDTLGIICWGFDKNFLWMLIIALKCFVPFKLKYVLSKKDKEIFLDSITEIRKVFPISLISWKKKFGIEGN